MVADSAAAVRVQAAVEVLPAWAVRVGQVLSDRAVRVVAAAVEVVAEVAEVAAVAVVAVVEEGSEDRPGVRIVDSM